MTSTPMSTSSHDGLAPSVGGSGLGRFRARARTGRRGGNGGGGHDALLVTNDGPAMRTSPGRVGRVDGVPPLGPAEGSASYTET